MFRHARLDTPGVLHRVVLRGDRAQDHLPGGSGSGRDGRPPRRVCGGGPLTVLVRVACRPTPASCRGRRGVAREGRVGRNPADLIRHSWRVPQTSDGNPSGASRGEQPPIRGQSRPGRNRVPPDRDPSPPRPAPPARCRFAPPGCPQVVTQGNEAREEWGQLLES